MSFIQIIEYETERPDEIMALDREFEEAGMPTRISHMHLTKDRENPNGYVTIVEFPSYEEAMANSKSPETQQFAARMTELCTGPPRFVNLDVLRELP
jgi:quinol monooxygenase YgiN